MSAHRIGCFTPKCKGVLHSVNDGASRLSAYFGREVYECDKCHNRYSVPPEWYAKQLQPGARPL